MTRALLALLLAACTVEQTAFEVDETQLPLTTCADAFSAASGHACALTSPCTRAADVDPLCCKELALCVEGKLLHERACDAACRTCVRDEECPFGAAICELDHCLPCPPADACPACPEGWEPRKRNGCATCACVPRSECPKPETCGPGLACYGGAFCGPRCDLGDLSCCANVCAVAEPRCPEPAPLGCTMRCPPESGCAHCVASHCICDAGVWHCKPMCTPVESVCVFAG